MKENEKKVPDSLSILSVLLALTSQNHLGNCGKYSR